MTKSKSENAKNKDFQVPMDLPSVKPEDYDSDIDSARGSSARNAGKKSPDAGPPDYTMPGKEQPTAKSKN